MTLRQLLELFAVCLRFLAGASGPAPAQRLRWASAGAPRLRIERTGRRLHAGAWLVSSVLATVFLATPQESDALQNIQAGYSATLLVSNLPAFSYPTMALAPSGNLVVPKGLNGILQITPLGAVSPWSATSVSMLAFEPDGSGYASGAPSCDCILRVNSDGSMFTFHQDSLNWDAIGLAGNDSLYAVVRQTVGRGLYAIDKVSGVPALIVGGSGAGGLAAYSYVAKGADGKLYVSGSLDGTLAGARVFRLDGDHLTAVASPPHGAGFMTLGPGGVFYAQTAYDYGSGFPTGEIWTVDPASGGCGLFAQTASYPGQLHPTLGGLQYDPSSQTLYAIEGVYLWAIRKSSTPAAQQSWGSVKAINRKLARRRRCSGETDPERESRLRSGAEIRCFEVSG